MPTISGLRRRGYTAAAIKSFCEKIGVTKHDSITDVALLEHSLRDDLNKTALRVMGVLNPLKIVITNYPEDLSEELDAVNNPEDESVGKRKVAFSKELYIEHDDFMEDPPKEFYRLSAGREVRFRYAYFITCNEVIKNDEGEVVELHCTYDPETKGGNAPDGRNVKATIHWVSAKHSIKREIRLSDRLFTVPEPDSNKEEKEFSEFLNPESLTVLKDCYLEPSLAEAKPGVNYQFERLGYFIFDPVSSSDRNPVFNRTLTLRDTWAKVKGK